MHRKYLQDRFTRKYDKKDVVVALEYYISIIASGYFGGKEPQFKVKNINETQKGILNRIFKRIFGEKNDPEDYQAIIDYIAKYNDNGSFFFMTVYLIILQLEHVMDWCMKIRVTKKYMPMFQA